LSNSKADQTVWPSIFNDVIGPVMRGPSSSHCAAALRIGRLLRDFAGGDVGGLTVRFDVNGSLATTHASQGSDMGLMGGLLGWEATDVRLPEALEHARRAGIAVQFEIGDYGFHHPNTYRFELILDGQGHTLSAISTGGGMIELIELEGISVSIVGDYYETLFFVDGDGQELAAALKREATAEAVLYHGAIETSIVEVKALGFLDAGLLDNLRHRFGIRSVKTLAPVLPVLSRREMRVPFTNCADMLTFNEGRNLALWQLALEYECARGAMSPEAVWQQMGDVVDIVTRSIAEGIAGTQYPDRILGWQSGRFDQRLAEGRLLDAGMFNGMIRAVSALMEVKSSMGVIVAAPTAGSCAGLPGACIAAAQALGVSRDEQIKALLAAGLIGVFIAARSTFAAEVGGCQAECGSGSGMAAAALVSLAGGTLRQGLTAASMALQNLLGLVCDPVANRVEVPCLGKNVLAAGNALACANMALADYDGVIPLDEVIEAMDRVGRSLPRELRCTALGGLSTTPTARKIEGCLALNERRNKVSDLI
jgi:L-serine dehydratase